MIKWLKDKKAMTAADIWGFDQALFTLKNLDMWIKTDGHSITDKGKQKADGKKKKRAVEKVEEQVQKDIQEKNVTLGSV